MAELGMAKHRQVPRSAHAEHEVVTPGAGGSAAPVSEALATAAAKRNGFLTLDVILTLTEQMLGTSPGDKEVYKTFVESKRPDNGEAEDESEAIPVDEEIALGTTVFMQDADGCPFVYDYTVKGFFKDACGMLRRADGTESKKLKAYKKEIDGLIFVTPRRIRLELPEGAEIGYCERPLRAQTAQGERVALARSQSVPAGTMLRFQVKLLRKELLPMVQEWFDYGQLRGLGQWRNSGMGRFIHECVLAPGAVHYDTADKAK